MPKTDINALQTRIETMLPTLNEYQRRRYLAIEAKTIGHSGVSLVSRLSNTTRKTITTGIKELNNPNTIKKIELFANFTIRFLSLL